ncbi:hypothetical protein LIER_36662 [Lithospermum erythrorhizon]|uniref:Uncharacterized protein n=1 Tax=Lithospermum erythrorhizon TaxID=34254 RepID=A0AAV3P953_LITER
MITLILDISLQKECVKEPGAIACVAGAVPTCEVSILDLPKGNYKIPTARPTPAPSFIRLSSAGVIAAYFITAEETMLECATRNAYIVLQPNHYKLLPLVCIWLIKDPHM